MEDVDPDRLPRRRSGRPLSFDRDAALRQAMLTFWRCGYETTSIVDLTSAMNISPPSLYAAFGDKERLFLEAARLYADQDAVADAIDNAPSAYGAARSMLMGAAVAYTGEETPKGCLLASATASGSAASSKVRATVADIRRSVRDRLRRRIESDVGSDPASPQADAGALADLVMAVVQGMSVLARDGASRTSLLAIGDAALKAWPRSHVDG